jgi:predicted ATPase/class 3 adenylate cyclase
MSGSAKAFLFSDIEGSNRLWELAPGTMAEALARHDAIMHRRIEQAGGSVFKTVGDAFCAVFPDASAAIQAALQAQIELQSESFDQIGSLQVRMAVHSGAALERHGDYFGPSLNRVARLLSAGHGGQILVSLAAAECVEDLAAGATLMELGEYRLRDLIKPERIFQLVHPALPSDLRSIRALEAVQHNLPIQLTSFIGREQELAEIERILSTTRLVTLTGAGGCGKSRLAQETGMRMAASHSDGVWLIEFAALADPSLVPQTLASVLGLREEPGRTWSEVLCEHMRAKHLLLILDNCEHVLAASAALAHTLLRACPAVKILATSREGLGVDGEITYRVPSLSLPDPGDTGQRPDDVLAGSEAARLFVERATRARPGFAVSGDNAEAILQLCRRLDGIPLALELAASRVRALSVDQILERLDDRFRLLTGGSRSALPRQQTLQALIDWSYNLLTEGERALFRRLSVFAGGWTLEAAEEVCSGQSIERPDVPELLARLVDKSVVVVDEEPAVRYRLLETVRQYGHDRLVQAGEAELTRGRHLEVFLHLAEKAAPKLRTGERERWLRRLDAERDNLRTALEWSLQLIGDPGAALRLSAALGWYWFFRSLYSEGRRWLGGALDRAESHSPTEETAWALFFAGILAWDQGDLVPARDRLEESLAVGRAVGIELLEAQALSWLSVVVRTQGDQKLGRLQLEESVALLRRQRDPWALALALTMLSELSLEEGDEQAAGPLADESLTLFGAVDDPWGMGTVLVTRGQIALRQGDLVAARSLIDQALETWLEIGHKYLITTGLYWAGKVALREQDLSRATARFREGLGVALELQSNRGIGEFLAALAEAAIASGNLEHGAQLFGAAEDHLRRGGGSLSSLLAQDSDLDDVIAQARDSLGMELFERAWDDGKAITPKALFYG